MGFTRTEKVYRRVCANGIMARVCSERYVDLCSMLPRHPVSVGPGLLHFHTPGRRIVRADAAVPRSEEFSSVYFCFPSFGARCFVCFSCFDNVEFREECECRSQVLLREKSF